MNERNEIKKKITIQLQKLVSQNDIFIKGLDNLEAYGHSAGNPLELWIKEELTKNGWKVYFPNKFISEIFDKIGDLPKIIQFLKGTFWDKLLITRKQFEDFLAKKPIMRWQQEGADLVLFYGKDIIKEPNKVILLNVKSHEFSRKSRNPNIMSAQRLLEYLESLIGRENGKELLKLSCLWFVGVTYNATKDGGKLVGIYIKDLFKIDTSKIPQINFDAAIQIQWHVENMIEIEQNNEDFALRLSEEFIKRWKKHSRHKEEKYTQLVQKIKERLNLV